MCSGSSWAGVIWAIDTHSANRSDDPDRARKLELMRFYSSEQELANLLAELARLNMFQTKVVHLLLQGSERDADFRSFLVKVLFNLDACSVEKGVFPEGFEKAKAVVVFWLNNRLKVTKDAQKVDLEFALKVRKELKEKLKSKKSEEAKIKKKISGASVKGKLQKKNVKTLFDSSLKNSLKFFSKKDILQGKEEKIQEQVCPVFLCHKCFIVLSVF